MSSIDLRGRKKLRLFYFMDLIEKTIEVSKPELQSLKGKVIREAKPIKLEAVNLSNNIQKFDKKPRLVSNPYNYNTISLKKAYEPTATQMISNPLYNTVGKMLGIDTVKEWNQFYDKVYKISEWARSKTKGDLKQIIKFIDNKSRTIPTMSNRRIDDIYIHATL